MRYINTDDLIKIFNTKGLFGQGIYQAIEEISTADVKPIVDGEWEYTGDMFNEGNLVCSKCGHKIDVADKSNFCPNCGADMRKESKE